MKIELGEEYEVLVRGYGFEVGDVIDVRHSLFDGTERFTTVVNRFKLRTIDKVVLEDMARRNRLKKITNN